MIINLSAERVVRLGVLVALSALVYLALDYLFAMRDIMSMCASVTLVVQGQRIYEEVQAANAKVVAEQEMVDAQEAKRKQRGSWRKDGREGRTTFTGKKAHGR